MSETAQKIINLDFEFLKVAGQYYEHLQMEEDGVDTQTSLKREETYPIGGVSDAILPYIKISSIDHEAKDAIARGYYALRNIMEYNDKPMLADAFNHIAGALEHAKEPWSVKIRDKYAAIITKGQNEINELLNRKFIIAPPPPSV